VDPPGEVRDALSRICAKVTRVGHSMSAVQMWVVPEGKEPEPNWQPDVTGQEARLRVARAGTLRSLKEAFNGESIQAYDALADALATARGQEKMRLKREIQARFPDGRPESRRPQLVHWQGYSRPAASEGEAPAADGPFDENFVVLSKFEGAMLGLESTLQLTSALRNSAMKATGTDVPEWLSGHDARGQPSLAPHAAFFPLPYVGFEHSDGHVLGLGMAIPRGLPAEELRRVLGPFFFDPETGEEREIRLWTKAWKWTLEREKRERPPVTLQRSSWTKAVRSWASVTPVVLHHYPKKREGDIERIIKEAFVSAMFPAPRCVRVQSVSAVTGAGHAMGMPPFTDGGAHLCRYQTHVIAHFDQPVRGPMLVGRGRFRGYGLFRPVADGEVR
jgi:CRISPR-associated protein Csb2